MKLHVPRCPECQRPAIGSSDKLEEAQEAAATLRRKLGYVD